MFGAKKVIAQAIMPAARSVGNSSGAVRWALICHRPMIAMRRQQQLDAQEDLDDVLGSGSRPWMSDRLSRERSSPPVGFTSFANGRMIEAMRSTDFSGALAVVAYIHAAAGGPLQPFDHLVAACRPAGCAAP